MALTRIACEKYGNGLRSGKATMSDLDFRQNGHILHKAGAQDNELLGGEGTIYAL